MRLSANFRLNNYSSLKLNYNRTIQYLHLLSNTASISPSDTWKLSDSYLQPESGDQIAAGYYRVLNKNKIEISAEIYYKRMDNMVDFKGGTDLVMNESIERDFVNVYGKAYGLELLVKKPGRTGSLECWIHLVESANEEQRIVRRGINKFG